MQLNSLNIWGGRLFEPLNDYILEQAENTDIFCFQEVFDTPTDNITVSEHYRANIYAELEQLLPHHQGYFAPVQNNMGIDGYVDYPLSWGVAMFIRKGVAVRDMDDFIVYGERNGRKTSNDTMPRNLQYVKVTCDDEDYTIAHFHGLWAYGGKEDTTERIEQSQKVKTFFDPIEEKKILCGDFNLLPETKSLNMLEEHLTNLIKTYNIETTRSSHYHKQYKHADYLLVSPDVQVRQFTVPNTEVSDHLPMILKFS